MFFKTIGAVMAAIVLTLIPWACMNMAGIDVDPGNQIRVLSLCAGFAAGVFFLLGVQYGRTQGPPMFNDFWCGLQRGRDYVCLARTYGNSGEQWSILRWLNGSVIPSHRVFYTTVKSFQDYPEVVRIVRSDKPLPEEKFNIDKKTKEAIRTVK